MASPPLETIPEAPTPPNSPTPARVTADPPKSKPAKNPGRVESGKRLAERNRLAREAKKKQQEVSAQPPATATDESESSGSSGLSLGVLIGIGGLVVAVLGLYYQREAIMTRLRPAPPPPQTAPDPTPPPSRIPVKQGIKKME